MFGEENNEGLGGFGGGFGPGFGRKRFFERGILKMMILEVVNDRPRHGYDIMQELEEKFQGFYTPSAGSIYPILQLFEDRGFVTGSEEDGKKIYTITADGKKELAKYSDRLKHIKDRFENRFGPGRGGNLRDLRGEIRETLKIVMRNAREGALKDPETMKKLRAAFADFRGDLEKIFAEKKN
ncbi:MAG TPA: PadR family transcriptional regulator [Candidatus Paceibacterota bacterium]|nr:PadR family transcriptional regulator [Candidatus Paceibacterota bacterium]